MLGWARLYPNKLPLTAVHTVNNEVLPTFEAEGATIDAVLSDNGREFCGREDQHPYELFLQLEGIKHKRTKVKRPQSNGIVERLHRTLLDEHFRVEGRRTWFDTIEEMQTVLDQYRVVYNSRRPHQGRGMNGRTPLKAFREGIPNQPKETPNPKQPPENHARADDCQGIAVSVQSKLRDHHIRMHIMHANPGAYNICVSTAFPKHCPSASF